MKTFSLKVPAKTKTILEILAANAGISLEEYVEQILKEVIENGKFKS